MKSLILIASFFSATNVFAYGTFLNSSNILVGNEYDVSGAAEFFSGDRRGTHALAIVDLPFTKQTNLRFQGGVGSLDFSLGASLKWVPVRDNQRYLFNFGLVTSVDYGRDDGFNAFWFRLSPFISKSFSWEHGTFEPYVTLPIGNVSVDSTSEMTTQFITGTKVKFDSLSYMYFSAEAGFDIKDAPAHFAIMATILLRK
jgi:hypothetical protein